MTENFAFPGRRWLSLLLLAALTGGCAARNEQPVAPGASQGTRGAQRTQSAGPPSPLNDLVRDVCDKSVVLLGEEAHHGSGQTLEVKSEVVKRLIEQCGFNAVYFESGGYEFLDLNRRLAAKTSAPEQVSDAIGGLWSVSNAIDPLVDFLYAQASAGRVRLAGLDPQLGQATSGYMKAKLPAELVQALKEPRRTECQEVISRRTNARFDAEHPDDEAARNTIVECFREAVGTGTLDPDLSALASATLTLLTNPPGRGRGWETRERQMAQLFRWYRERTPGVSKVIVWTANVHATRSAEVVGVTVRPFGDELHAELGDKLAAIAFTALGGEYGRSRIDPIPPAPPSSLETQALAGGDDAMHYVPKAALAKLGYVDASILNYDATTLAEWSLLFDGVFVLREEKPLTIDRGVTPRFVPADRAQ